MSNLWATIRDQAYDSIGLDKDTRDQLQPLVDQAAALGASAYPTGAYIPPNTQGTTGSTIPSGVGFFGQQFFGIPAWIILVVLGVFLILLIKRK